MRARTWTAVSAGAVLTSLVTAVPAQAEPAGPAEQARASVRVDQGALAWGPCEDLRPVADEDLECATLTVPLARTADGGRAEGDDDTVRLALSRVPATGEAEHTLLVNPGGPGSAGRMWASYTHQRMPAELRETYDVVAFDPRGVGASTPSIACDPSLFEPVRPDTVPADAAAEAALRADARDYARSCADNTGPLLQHTRTEDTAHDMDAIREALGLERIDYLGYSYGSYLGTVYSALHPDRVRALVLDSVVHPDRPWYESNLAQSRALDRAARNFFDWTARHDDVYGLGTTGEEVAEAYYALRSELADEPVGGTVGPTELEGAAIVVAYSGASWPSVAGALSARINDGDGAPLLALHEAHGEDAESDRGYGGYLAVQCTDSHWPEDWSTWRADAERVHREAPFMTWNNVWYNAPCATWKAGSGDWLQVGDGPGEHPAYGGDALLVHATEDGATPVEGAFALRERLPGAVLVTEEGGHTHGVSLTGNTCVDEVVAAYLRDGELPARAEGTGPDVTCEARPEPRPVAGRDGSGSTAAPVAPGSRGASGQPVE
ncbi:pimeloyl-ACP methyl ester carboxylesterase [Nocardiopsis arvandica]|uniref:Pimeloyl-ACP methyl ester carboxylesterase n=1 Tax=Nocardiopsis sinuspersici TaxID=501010 RepID=A0A7Y9XC45_9ACTN|nr:pimeloyl-ACP methyl ester carboxylesterase [Nocardiopsis sinuspersici]